ncbi:MAG TPA: hypothetical protein PKY59_06285 [Pyrinomonadaceae bacterium]|nr:hypothetical protein [Pyrinomonadaceae bacterium]
MTEDEKIKIEPEFNRALNIWHEDKPLEAINILKKLDENFPNHYVISFTLSAIYHDLEIWQQTLKYSKKAVAFSPKSESASIILFHSLFNLKKYQEAFDEIKRFLAIASINNKPLKEYDLLIRDWKKDLNLATDNYSEIIESVFQNITSQS